MSFWVSTEQEVLENASIFASFFFQYQLDNNPTLQLRHMYELKANGYLYITLGINLLFSLC